MIIDTFTLQQFDADFTTPQADIIGTGRAVVVGEGDGASVEYRNNPVTAIAIDPAGRYLYAATQGKIHVIDLNPNSPTYHQIIRTDPLMTIDVAITAADRSEARRVGKECVSTCRSRWSPYT